MTWKKIPAPFYEDDAYKSKFGVEEQMPFVQDMEVSPVLITDPWSIRLIHPKNKNIIVKEENLERILSIGKKIVSCDPTIPLGIAIEYNGHSK